jgi:hypothetical protein
MYRKKNQEDHKYSSNHQVKSSAKITEHSSPSLHEQLRKSKHKLKSSKMSRENTSVQVKCKMIADSQKGKSKHKGKGKKSKSKKKGDSRSKELMGSPLSTKRFTSATTITESARPPAPPAGSRSKSKARKKQSGCKPGQ